MEPFNSKDGRLIKPHDHLADFTGDNNRSKSKVLIWLLHNKGKYRTARQLAEDTGCAYAYLKGRLSFWYNIRYINRHAVLPARGRPHWAYCIAERGAHFVNDRIPANKYDEYIKEVKEWLSFRKAARVAACVP